MSRIRSWVHANRLLAGLTAFCLLLILAVGGLVIGTISLRQSATTAGQAKAIAQRAKTLAGELKQQQSIYHASRVADQQRTDAEIRGLACVLVSRVDENAPGYPADLRRAVKQYRALYHCPAYSVRGAANPLPATTPATSTAPVTPRAPTVTRTAPAPAPSTVTHTVTPTPRPRPSTSPSPSTTPPSLCGTVHVPIVCR